MNGRVAAMSKLRDADRRARSGFRAAAAVLLMSMAAGCDDGTTIHSVTRTTTLDDGRVRAMAAGGMPLIVLGAPWSGATAEMVADNTRLPNGFPPEVRFRLLDAAAASDRYQDKVFLVFNAQASVRAERLCAGAPPPDVGPGGDGPFELVAVFCDGDVLMGSGVLRAARQGPGDWEEFTRVVRVLFSQILSDFSGRSER